MLRIKTKGAIYAPIKALRKIP